MINAQNLVPARESMTCLILRAVSFILSASLYLLVGGAVCVAADPPDLSQLSDAQKEQGFGQLQAPDPEPPPSPSPPPDRDKDKRKHHYHPNYIVGAGAGATGGVIVGNSLRKQSFRSAEDYDINSPVDYNSDLPQVPLQQSPDPSEYYVEDPPPAKLMNFDGVPTRPNIEVDVQALFARDLSRFDAQIVDGINTNQLGWSGASGIEVALRIQRPTELGLEAGFALIGGDDEARTSSAHLLYTKPSIGFAASPFVSYRDTSLATVEGNMLSPVFPWGQARLGMRWLHVQDTLENQVLPNGLFQHIETKSNSFLIQLALEPSLEFKRVRLESLFQIGIGPVFSKSNTHFRNLVGGPPGLPSEIVLDRASGTVFFKGRLGLAIPIRHWLVARTGVQLLAQSDTAPASAQISHTDLALQRFHLRTESMAIGALFVGIELKR